MALELRRAFLWMGILGAVACGGSNRPSDPSPDPDPTSSSLHHLCGIIFQPSPGNVTVKLSGTQSQSITAAASSTPFLPASASYCFDVPNGTYVVTPSLAGATFEPASAEVTVRDGDQSVDFFDQVCGVSGHVSGPGGIGTEIVLKYSCGNGYSPVTCTKVLASADDAGAYSVRRPYRYFISPYAYLGGSESVEPKNGGFGYTPSSTALTFDALGQMQQDFASSYAISGVLHAVDLAALKVCFTVNLGGDSTRSLQACGGIEEVTGSTKQQFREARYAIPVTDGTYSVSVVPPEGFSVEPTTATITVKGGNVVQDFTLARKVTSSLR